VLSKFIGSTIFFMKTPQPLHPGDKIGIIAPARKISMEELTPALEIIYKQGFEPVLGENIFKEEYQFAGSDKLRAFDFQNMLDNPEIKAVISARGGYGSVRIVDNIDFSFFEKAPKWLVGYSDFTVFLNHVTKNFKTQTLHATMPVNFADNTTESLTRLFDILKGEKTRYLFKAKNIFREGKVTAKLVGGNLSVLYSLLNSISFPETDGNILFLEDLDEYLYHIDRMIMALKRSGKLKNLAGLVVGAMTDMHDNTVPFGKTAEEIIYDAVSEYDYPVITGFNAGHITNNLPLIIGSNSILEVENGTGTLKFF